MEDTVFDTNLSKLSLESNCTPRSLTESDVGHKSPLILKRVVIKA